MLDGVSVAEALASTFGSVQGLRAHAIMPDTFFPPGVVVGQPDIALDGVQRTFNSAEWSFPCYLVVERIQDRKAQTDLFSYIEGIVQAVVDDSTLGGVVQHAQVLDARPNSVNVNGQELPGYLINVQILA